jgi:L-asparaginase II
MPDPVIAEVTRGGIVESRHRGAFAVADADGRLMLSGGDPERAIFPRSAVKAMQALPLVIGGAASRFGLSEAALALSCASHTGTPAHTAVAAAMLQAAGRDEHCLECGTHWPTSPAAARDLAAAGGAPCALHNNCSGKHAGFICTAVAAGLDPEGYVAADHPIMRGVIAALQTVTGADPDRAPLGIDGCSIPTLAMPLRAIAAGFARFGTGLHLPPDMAAAAARLRSAVAANPLMIAGDEKFDTVLTAAFGSRVFVKSGAEGVCCGALPELGLGFAIKADDGGLRGVEAACASLLRRLLGPHAMLDGLAETPVANWNGVATGAICGRLG